MSDLLSIVTEVRGRVEEMKTDGLTKEEIRDNVLGSMQVTTNAVYRTLSGVITASMDAGLLFVYRIHEALGAVNAVLAQESIAPIFVKEINMARGVIEALEETTLLSMDSLFSLVEQKLREQGGELN